MYFLLLILSHKSKMLKLFSYDFNLTKHIFISQYIFDLLHNLQIIF